jgi:hypothetical protein
MFGNKVLQVLTIIKFKDRVIRLDLEALGGQGESQDFC